MVITRDGFFYPFLTLIIDSFLAHLKKPHSILEKHETDFQKTLNTSTCGQRAAVRFLSFPQAGTGI